jgi:type I restriction enzyme R subunit
MTFEFFDRRGDVTVREGNLPHWYQPGVTYFVTYRTEDSVPRALIRSWHARRDAWLRRHGFDPSRSSWKLELRQRPDAEREYHQNFTREFMEYLDRGYGACILRRADLARLIAENLQHFDGERYRLGDFVVMPNHVHLLVCLLGATEIERQCKSWKRYSAGEINRAIGGRGRFWQEESFDHLVRSPEQFAHFQRYIAENPVKASLSDGEFLHWQLPKS